MSGVQGLACLAYVAAKRPASSASSSETPKHLQGWFKRSLEHFALTWLTRNIGAALKVDACNLSDFRGRPDQMGVSYLALASLRSLLGRVLTLIKDGPLPSLPTLQRYQESVYRKAEVDGTNPSLDELDTFEDLTAAVSANCLFLRAHGSISLDLLDLVPYMMLTLFFFFCCFSPFKR